MGKYDSTLETLNVLKFLREIKKKTKCRFRQNYVDDVMRKLDEIRTEKGLANNDTTFVGMHYRGGDYIPHLQGNHGDKFKVD